MVVAIGLAITAKVVVALLCPPTLSKVDPLTLWVGRAHFVLIFRHMLTANAEDLCRSEET